MIVGFTNTSSYELFSRGYRVVFLGMRASLVNQSSLKFGWPNNFNDTGLFWTNMTDISSINNCLRNVYDCTDKEWKNIYEDYSGVMHYDFKNNSLRKIFNKVGITEKVYNA